MDKETAKQELLNIFTQEKKVVSNHYAYMSKNGKNMTITFYIYKSYNDKININKYINILLGFEIDNKHEGIKFKVENNLNIYAGDMIINALSQCLYGDAKHLKVENEI
ncbi:MAG: hypothetical protein M1576_04145 [Deltaproteobacteria bacterium]|nr:hypothetical protein [Deltaproteobacteria bacterium]